MRPAFLAVCIVCVLCVGDPTLVWALKPDSEYKALPSHYGIAFEEVTISTCDGIPIRGWFFPAQEVSATADRYVGRLIPMPIDLRPERVSSAIGSGEPGPTIVVCNGDAANMTYLILYAYHFCTHEFNVLTFDWRGFGESGEWQIDRDQLSYSEFLDDYDAAINYAIARPETDPEKIGLFGFSTGAYLSFAMAAKRSDVAAFVGRGLITSFDDALPILAELEPHRDLHAPIDYPVELLPLYAASKVKSPTLLIVGENDNRTPEWMSRSIYERLAGQRELWVVPGAEHGGANAPEYANYPEFFVRVCSFFEKVLE